MLTHAGTTCALSCSLSITPPRTDNGAVDRIIDSVHRLDRGARRAWEERDDGRCGATAAASERESEGAARVFLLSFRFWPCVAPVIEVSSAY